ncbi:cytochrome P450 [Cristinia sonorae]|uniref:Cytochrome P450 n=1 Tax=Cristinia sonorae TaxID=1940300 RepID=A0A8K0UZK3_9AGAR|nr:cytochrome P450 [Cristinia sonorae]
MVIKYPDIYEETAVFQMKTRWISGQGLLATIDEPHRQQRKILNTSFSPGQLKEIFPIMYNYSHSLEGIGQCTLGYSFEPLIEDLYNPCGEAFNGVEATIFLMHVLRVLLPYIVNIGSAHLRRHILEWIPYPRLQRVREIVDTLDKTAKEILQAKRAVLTHGDEAMNKMADHGKDTMSLLLKSDVTADAEDRISDVELLGHMSTLIFAGMNTVSHTTSRILHQLSRYQEIQNKLRDELLNMQARSIQDGNDLTYDDLLCLPYLDALCKETLFPAVSFIGRRTQESTTMRLTSNTYLGLWGNDAHEWRPERWFDTNIVKGSGGTKTPGEAAGPAGYRFAEMEMKAILYTLLPSFGFDLPSDKEIC